MRLASTLVTLVLGFAACAAAWAQPAQPAAPPPAAPPPAETAEPPEPDEPAEGEAAAPGAPGSERRARRNPRVFSVTWEAPEPLKKLFEEHLPPPRPAEGERRAGSLRPWIRDIRRRVPEIAASEGYFSSTLEVEYADEARSRVIVKVTPGPIATVGAI